MSYWDETDRIKQANGGKNPICQTCKQEMYPADDHGRFICGCTGVADLVLGFRLRPRPIRQVSTAGMENADKVKIPPIHRLNSAPTDAEQRLLTIMLKGPGAMDSPEYIQAQRELEEERRRP